MNKKFENKIAMLDGVHAFIAEHGNVIAENSGLRLLNDDLKRKTDEIRNLESIRINISKGKADAKNVSRKYITSVGLSLASKLFDYAKKSGNSELKSQSDKSRSELERYRDTEQIIVMLKIIENAETYFEVLKEYGLTRESLDKFKADLNLFRDSLENKTTSAALRVSAGKSLTVLFREAKEILKTIDMAVEEYNERDITFYNGYKSVRMIKDLGTRYRVPKEMNQLPETLTENKGQ
ncbi:MAG: hypothetical protein HGGPFJEG_01886 [Ignavibacteria bacterium]|nr:hypothetical protein [Ignavibacteria bacterium]